MKTHLNFLPPSVRRKQSTRACLIRWSIVAVICLIALALFAWHESRLTASKRFEVASLQEKHTALLALESRLNILRDELLTPVKLDLPEFNTAKHYSLLSLMGVLSQSMADCQEKLCVQNLRFRQIAEQTSGTDVFESTIDGFATDLEAVTAFAEKLRAAKLFREVKIVSTAESQHNGFGIIVYQLRCTY
jgi:hypothetical protein